MFFIVFYILTLALVESVFIVCRNHIDKTCLEQQKIDSILWINRILNFLSSYFEIIRVMLFYFYACKVLLNDNWKYLDSLYWTKINVSDIQPCLAQSYFWTSSFDEYSLILQHEIITIDTSFWITNKSTKQKTSSLLLFGTLAS